MTIKLTKLSAIKHLPGVPVETYKIAVSDWAKVPRCEIQRNEFLRSNYPHLRALQEPHRNVAMAVLPDGSFIKIDGHSRGNGWKMKTLEQPSYLSVTVYSVNTKDDAESLYLFYDNVNAVKGAADGVQSGMFKAGLNIKSEWIAKGKIGNGLNMASQWANLKIDKSEKIKLVAEFKDEIALLDSIPNLNGKMFPSAWLGATFLSLRKYGADVLPLWKAVNAKSGNETSGKKDAAKFIIEYLETEKKAKLMAGMVNNQRQIRYVLGCVERYMNGNKASAKEPNKIEPNNFLPSPMRGSRLVPPRGAKVGRPANSNLKKAA